MKVVDCLQSMGARANQEDAFGIIPGPDVEPGDDLLMLLADGMGGHAGGEVASALLVKSFADYCIGEATSPRPRERMRASLDAANAALKARKDEAPDLADMGSTLISAIKLGSRLVWLSVGDSLLYLYRQGRLTRLNADHSVHGELMELVRAGRMTRQEADSHPRRNALRSAVIGEPVSLVDCNAIALERGDLVLLASDGLDTLDEDRIAAILSEAGEAEARMVCALLLNAVEAAARPRQDNTTVLCYRYLPAGSGRRRESLFADMLAEAEPANPAAAAPAPSRRMLAVLAAVAAVALALVILAVGFSRPPAPVSAAAPAPRPAALTAGARPASTIAAEPGATPAATPAAAPEAGGVGGVGGAEGAKPNGAAVPPGDAGATGATDHGL